MNKLDCFSIEIGRKEFEREKKLWNFNIDGNYELCPKKGVISGEQLEEIRDGRK